MGIRSYGVGITTLEEVFLKIGKHSDEDKTTEEDEEELKRFTLDKNSRQPSDIEENVYNKMYEEYSIAEQHETGLIKPFMLNLFALMKKKLTLQIRDVRTLMIEIFFPIIFIFAGLALANFAPFSNGRMKDLTLNQFPSPSHLIYNNPSSLSGDPANFIQSNIAPSGDWDLFT